MRIISAVAASFVAGAVVLVSPASAAPAETVTMTLQDAIAGLPLAAEVRDGYERTKFRHWVDADRDSCNTRQEVLIEEAIVPPAVGPRCVISGGLWRSYYDSVTTQNAKDLDIDHVVPLAEAWDSGASAWTPSRRQAYANDLGDSRSLAAVSAGQNRQKGDQDPGTWVPKEAAAHCRYVGEWAVVKTRWSLSVDPVEKAALEEIAAGCPNVLITVEIV